MSGPVSRVFDPGLQPERTALAWRRTGLALGGASLLLARVFAETSLPLALMVGGGGVGAAIILMLAVDRRYRTHHRRLTAAPGVRIPLAEGVLPALVAAITVAFGIAAVAAVTLSALLK